jgi:hypothetical protein
MSYQLYILCIAALVLPVSGFSAIDSTKKVLSPNLTSIDSPQAAVKRVFQYTGFKEIKDISREQAEQIAHMVTARDSTTPFLSKRIDGARAWEVKLDSVFLDFPTWNQEMVQRQNQKNFIALIDSASGLLLKIYSQLGYYDPDLAPEPLAAIAENHWHGLSFGYFNSLPRTPLITALGEALTSNPLKAKELLALHVIYRNLQDTLSAWIILGRGVPPIPGDPRDDAPDYVKNRVITVVNDETGRLRAAFTAPPVELREEDKDYWKK